MFWSYSCMLFFTAGNSVPETHFKSCRACSFHTCSGFCARKLKFELGNKTHLFQCLLFFCLTAWSAAWQIYSLYEHSIQSSLSGSWIRSIQWGGFSSVYCRQNSSISNTFMWFCWHDRETFDVFIEFCPFKWPGWYLHLSDWFMKNVSIIWAENNKIMK